MEAIDKLKQIARLYRNNNLTEKQKAFCHFMTIDFDNYIYAVYAYAKAYQIDISTPKGNQVARSGASRLFKNPKVSEHYWKLRDIMGC